ncbi:MAG: DUF1501 domain-containing protein [Planctomycetota bacterium]|jgi:hypothetical protein
MDQSRRSFIYGLGASIGSVALTDMLARDGFAAAPASAIADGSARPGQGPLAPKPQMLPAKAKACIYLCMEGGPSHVDTFDPKPQLNKLHLTESKLTAGLATSKRFFVGSPFKSRKVGHSGIEMSDQFKFMADPEVADEMCIYHGCHAESLNHPEALYHMNTGSRLGGDPGIGAWVTYGLGTVNQNLPGYVVMTELALPQGGPGNWTNGYLPAYYQGTTLRSTGSPILDLKPPAFKTRAQQRRALDELAFLNNKHAARHESHAELDARTESYELAFRMQMQVPDVIDLQSEPEAVREMYGMNRTETKSFGSQCLMARRLVEKGVRFVQIFSGGWDSHDYLERGHSSRINSVDQPIAALIRDLKARGMLDETLIIWSGEFGRTPDNTRRGGVTALGRGHNADAMVVMMAGAGVPKGTRVGATDEIGAKAAEVVHPIRDLHCTYLRLLGLDDNKLTYFHGGRFKQLSQTGGQVINELIA